MPTKDELLQEFQELNGSHVWDKTTLSKAVRERIATWLSFLHVENDATGQNNTTTYNNRRSNIISWVLWCARNDKDALDPEREDILEHIDSIYNKLSDPSIGARVSTVCIHYLWTSNRSLIGSNPFDGFSVDEYEHPIDPNTPTQITVLRSRGELDDQNVIAVSPQIVQKIWRNAPTPTLFSELCIRLMWETGIRCKELTTIEIGDKPDWSKNELKHLDREQRRITIQTAKTSPKDANYWREVYYSPQLDRLLHTYITQARGESKYAADSPYLLVTSHAPQLRPSYVSRKVKQAAYNAGVNEALWTDAAGKHRHLITGHTLRHSFASYRANHTDMKLHILADLMGHRKLDTTRQYISRDDNAQRNQAADAHKKLRRTLGYD